MRMSISTGSIKLAQLAMELGPRKFIHISSGGAVYGEPVYLPCDEDHPVRPLCPYGASKYTFEMYLFMFKELYGLDYSVIRYPNVYGPRQDPNGEAGVVAIFIGQMLAGKPVTINGSGEQVRDFVYVCDCAKANLATLEQGFRQGVQPGLRDRYDCQPDLRWTERNHRLSPEEAHHGLAKVGETFRIYLGKTPAGRKPTGLGADGGFAGRPAPYGGVLQTDRSEEIIHHREHRAPGENVKNSVFSVNSVVILRSKGVMANSKRASARRVKDSLVVEVGGVGLQVFVPRCCGPACTPERASSSTHTWWCGRIT